MFTTASKSIASISALLGTTGSLFKRNQCASQTEDEAAAEFQRILESNNGEMPSDPEEMQALLARSRPIAKRNP